MTGRLFRATFVSSLLGSILISLSYSSIHTARAQAGEAVLTGEVHDQTGAAVEQAQLLLTQSATGKTFTSTTGESGVYTFTNLKPGFYTIAVEATGFKRTVREGIRLVTGERVRVDVLLEPGTVTESVIVNGDASLLRTETGSLGQVITSRKIVDIPLNGRNFLSLAALSPGVAQPPPTTAGPSFPRINGGRPRTNEYLFDGISVLQPEPGQVAFFPIPEAIQEFKVEVNSPPAEFGRFNGGVVNLTTRSGTNDFHGTAFEFFRNEALNARNLFAPKTAANPKKPVFRRNQFGFAAGGPIIRNSTFFFGDYQGTRQLIGRVLTSTVPTLLQQLGDFSASLGAPLFLTPSGTVTTTAAGNTPITVTDTNGSVIQARTGQIFRPGDRRAYAGNLIPVGTFDPVAAALLSRYPSPTTTGAANNFSRVGNESQSQGQFDVRIDHRFSDSNQLFGRFSYAKDITNPVTPLPEGSGNLTSGVIGLTDTRAASFVGNYVRVFSPRVINELRFGYTRRSIKRQATALDGSVSQALNLPGIPSNAAFQNTLPTFTIAGFQQLGSPANTASDFRTDVTQIFDAVSLQRGRHSIKFGLDWRWERLDVIQPPSPTGQFTFSTLFTNSQGIPGVGTALSGFTGNSLASFLLGQVQTFTIDLQRDVLRPRAHIQEYFVQDDWKATSRLTINAGLRYTLNFPSTILDNQGAVFNLQTQQLDYLGQNGFPETARRLHKLDFGPRLGIAYRVGERMVLRAGYGLTWIEQAGITTPFTVPQFPFVQTITQRTLDNLNPAFLLSAGPSVAATQLTPDAGLGQGVFTVDRDLGSGYVQQWNFAVQREITKNMVLEVAYAGSKITHVGIPDTNINQLTAEQLALGPTLLERLPNPFFGQIPRNSSLGDPTIPRAQLLKPFPRFTTVSFYRNNVGNTSYNALQAKVEQRFSRGLSFLVSYTRSKLIDEASSVFDASILTGPVANFPVADSYNRRLERDLSSGDIPNVFVASFTWELPFGKGKRFNPGSILGKLLEGWEVAGVVILQSGLPLAVTQVTNFNAFAGFGTQRPNRVADPELSNSQRTTTQWFNTTAFTVAPQFTLGNSSRNPVRGPGYRNADLAFIKRTYFTETVNLEFRTEVFNLTNTPPLGNPNLVLGSAGFGSITSAGDPRVIQFGLKLNF
ncbi:MAG TPA: carboxypeptidase regulatory-like domain-containing protein [Pyrinomonadaceae bacterium]|nr:carboxypeptidase regulatory-like domain-containing protein [Pyrinomonadaceae bacterium]